MVCSGNVEFFDREIPPCILTRPLAISPPRLASIRADIELLESQNVEEAGASLCLFVVSSALRVDLAASRTSTHDTDTFHFPPPLLQRTN